MFRRTDDEDVCLRRGFLLHRGQDEPALSDDQHPSSGGQIPLPGTDTRYRTTDIRVGRLSIATWFEKFNPLA